VVQCAIAPPGSGILHVPPHKIRCGDVLCRGERCERENVEIRVRNLFLRSDGWSSVMCACNYLVSSWARGDGAL